MGRPVNSFALLRDHPLFGTLPRAVLERFSAHFTKRRIQRGTTIFCKGDARTELIAVLSGSVRISTPAADGREAVLNLIREGEIFGEVALLDGQPRSADAVAASDCEIMVVDRREFIAMVRKQPEFAFKLIETLCARLRRTSEQVEDLMFLDLPMRLAKTILRLADEVEGGWPRKFAVTQRELSELIGMSRESTNKQLRYWVQAGLIKVARGRIVVLRPDALTGIVGRT